MRVPVPLLEYTLYKSFGPLMITPTEWRLRSSILKALKAMETFAIDPLLVALTDTNSFAIVGAAEAIVQIDASRVDSILVSSLSGKDLAVVAGAHAFFIRRGTPGSEHVLIEALQSYGGMEMATNFLNSGNRTLRESAERWASNHDLKVNELMGDKSRPRWGK